MARRRRDPFAIVGTDPDATIDVEEVRIILASFMHDAVREEVEKQVAIGNDRFAVVTDGTFRGMNIDAIDLAQFRVAVDFIYSSVDLAISLFKQAFQREIQAFVVDKRGLVFNGRKLGSATGSALANSVRVWFGTADGKVTEVSGASEIKNFEEGDYVMMTITDPVAAIANSYMFRNKQRASRQLVGFMGRTARWIRRKLRVTARSSPLRVQAAFSRTVGGLIGVTAQTAGRIGVAYGHPVIYVRLRSPRGGARGR